MTSQLLSRIFNQNSASIYETLRQNDAAENSGSDTDDLEERAGMLPSESGPEHDEDSVDDDESTFELRHQPPAPASSSFLAQSTQRPFFSNMSRSRGNRYAPPRFRDEEPEENDEVPASLLFEPGGHGAIGGGRQARSGVFEPGKMAVGGPGPATEASRKRNLTGDQQWAAVTPHAHREGDEHEAKEVRRQARLGLIDPKERALWKWANVENLDNFLNDVSTISHLSSIR